MAKKAVITTKDNAFIGMQREAAERVWGQILTAGSSGIDISDVHFEGVGVPKKGGEFISKLKQIYPFILEEELKASEIVMLAEA